MTSHLPKLREIRQAKGISREDLAGMVDCSEATIRRAENAIKGCSGITLYSAVAIADALGVSLDVLLDRDGYIPPKTAHRNVTDFLVGYQAP